MTGPASIAVTVDAEAASAKLAAIRGIVAARRAVHDAAANAVSVQVRGWLIQRNRRVSRHATSGYWGHAAEAVSAEADDTSGRVIIRHPGVAWHRYGGTIHARPGKALAIPLRDEVYGVWPSEFFRSRGDAFVWRSPRGQAFLAAAKGGGVRRGARTLRILYLLLKSVSKASDPTVLPTAADMEQTATAAVRSLVRLVIDRRMKEAGHG